MFNDIDLKFESSIIMENDYEYKITLLYIYIYMDTNAVRI